MVQLDLEQLNETATSRGSLTSCRHLLIYFLLVSTKIIVLLILTFIGEIFVQNLIATNQNLRKCNHINKWPGYKKNPSN